MNEYKMAAQPNVDDEEYKQYFYSSVNDDSDFETEIPRRIVEARERFFHENYDNFHRELAEMEMNLQNASNEQERMKALKALADAYTDFLHTENDHWWEIPFNIARYNQLESKPSLSAREEEELHRLRNIKIHRIAERNNMCPELLKRGSEQYYSVLMRDQYGFNTDEGGDDDDDDDEIYKDLPFTTPLQPYIIKTVPVKRKKPVMSAASAKPVGVRRNRSPEERLKNYEKILKTGTKYAPRSVGSVERYDMMQKMNRGIVKKEMKSLAWQTSRFNEIRRRYLKLYDKVHGTHRYDPSMFPVVDEETMIEHIKDSLDDSDDEDDDDNDNDDYDEDDDVFAPRCRKKKGSGRISKKKIYPVLR